MHMSEQLTPTQDPADFRVVLRPHRSLGPRGFLILMIGVGLVSFVAGVAFLLIGAWPVFGFFGLDVLLVYVAFRLNYRSGRQHERLELTPDILKITHVQPSGRSRTIAMNPYWVRVQLQEGADGRTDLRLASHGRELPIGRFLTDDERRHLAVSLRGALQVVRAAPSA
jgi:uncharacterized membrane protein